LHAVAQAEVLEDAGDVLLRDCLGQALKGDPDYLAACEARYREDFGGRLHLIETRIDRSVTIERVDLLIANLIIEYVGLDEFVAFAAANARSMGVLSCVIQRNNGEGFVSSTDHASSFDALASVSSDIDPETLTSAMLDGGFVALGRCEYPLPNDIDPHPAGLPSRHVDAFSVQALREHAAPIRRVRDGRRNGGLPTCRTGSQRSRKSTAGPDTSHALRHRERVPTVLPAASAICASRILSKSTSRADASRHRFPFS
jgi:hypothetical protein